MLALLAAVVAAAAYVLRDTPPPESVDDAELNRLIADKQAQLSRAENATPPASSGANVATSLLYIDSNPSGAFVLLDADTIGITPIDGRTVKTGVYVLSIRKENYAPRDTVVFVLEEEASPRLFVDLDPAGSYLGEDLIASSGRAVPGLDRSPAAGSRERGETQPPPRQSVPARERTASPGGPAASASDLTTSSNVRTSERSARGTTNQRSAPPQSSGAQAQVEPTPALTGLVTVLVQPWGSIYIDGHLEKLNTDVQHTAALPEGRHVVRVEHPALGTREQVVVIRNGEPRHVVFDLLESGETESELQNAVPDRGDGRGSSGNDGS